VFLEEILHRAGRKTEIYHSIAVARRLLFTASVVLRDEKLPDGNLKDVLTNGEALSMDPVRYECLRRPIRRIWLAEDANNLRGREGLWQHSTSPPEEQE
jgi:hypothetical protein